MEWMYRELLERQSLDHALFMRSYYSREYMHRDIKHILEELEYLNIPDFTIDNLYQTYCNIRHNYLDSHMRINLLNIPNLFSDTEWYELPHLYRQRYNTTISKYYSHLDRDWSWFPLIGFIRDLGNTLLSNIDNWNVLGDTLPLGADLDPNYPYYHKNYHKNNESFIRNIYPNHTGFRDIIFCWNRDQYLSDILNNNNIQLPEEAIYIIRYQRFKCWHSPENRHRGYTYLANEYDWKMLPLLKLMSIAFSNPITYEKNLSDVKSCNNSIDHYLNKSVLKWYYSDN